MFIYLIVVKVLLLNLCQNNQTILNMYGFLHVSYILIEIVLKRKNMTFLHVSVPTVAYIGNTLNSVHLGVEAIQKTG